MTSTPQLQQDPVMDRVPIEIIEAFGHYLNGPSLLACIQVCQRWHQVLRPLLWTSITKTQFYHPQFPLHSQCTPEDIAALQKDLFQVRHIEWSCKATTNSRRWQAPRKPTMVVSMDQLHLIFTYTSNLQTLTLHLWGMDTRLACLEALNPRTLRRLEITAAKEECVALDRILPLLSGLKELRLSGRHSSWTPSVSRTSQPPPGTIFKLTRLHIHCLDKALLQYCPELRELELYWPTLSYPHTPLAFREILTCTKLETLTFTPDQGLPLVQDLPEVLTSLRGLKRLTFAANSVAEVEFLCALDAGDMAPQMTERTTNGLDSQHGRGEKALVLPLLEYLHITAGEDLPTDDHNLTRLHQWLNLLLGSRPALKTIIVQDLEFDPRELSMENWACKDLEALSLEFSWTLSALPDEERVGLWRRVYRQIGTFSKLKTLMLRCAGLEMGDDSGIEALAGARGLKQLALADELSETWSRKEVGRLLQIFPMLTALCLYPLLSDEEATTWLQESESPLELTSHGAMMQTLGDKTMY
ncbi:hypothetical protein BGZ70_008957 [Mortierella alpina]|uniref:F-box domain-containing protein n=1 Tax=Mortierella alpina TaxID=64518 RepID=A0A9P6M105_MORAP|nr:hypothetical protein BGZ70_008957 [Mortierella alpina]